MSKNTRCPVCLNDAVCEPFNTTYVESDGTKVESMWLNRVECKSCGEFVIHDVDAVNFRSERNRFWTMDGRSQFGLSALVREHFITGLPPYLLRDGTNKYEHNPVDRLTIITIQELLRRQPGSVPERIERTLCNLARLSRVGGSVVTLDSSDVSLFFANTSREGEFHAQTLNEYGYIKLVTTSPWEVIVTARGWARFEELTAGKASPNNPAFVAMWFGGPSELQAMQQLYELGISPAIEDAGYKAARVDLVEHNEYIMDEVLGGIRRAPFVVADFTGHRNGVYFEAGFTRGLGIPVICTCREDCFDKAHFDTQQLNHIRWNTPAELRQRLSNRILGTIGTGPYCVRTT